MQSKRLLAITGILLVSWVAGCVTTGTHEKVLADLDKTKADLQARSKELDDEKKAREAERTALDGKLSAANQLNQQQESILSAMNMKVEKLAGERGELADSQKKLQAQVDELNRMRAAAERRNADFRSLLEKLKGMMDAGTLKIKPRNGLLVVQMSSDVVFAPASTRIKPEAKEALSQLASTLATFEGRRFQVVGHSDNKPIRSKRFRSNWELSTARAVVVVKLLIEAGVKPEMIGAAGNAEFDPLVDNETKENRTINRRVEIVFLPQIDELPAFDQVLSGS